MALMFSRAMSYTAQKNECVFVCDFTAECAGLWASEVVGTWLFVYVLYVFEHQCSHDEEGVKGNGLRNRRFYRVIFVSFISRFGLE
jgi:hypothetical protein